MPWDARYRKTGVQGITANAIDVVIETGDSGPVTPIGINLPNDQTVRERYGSKSVSLSNVNEAYDQAQPPSFRSEFAWTPEEAERATQVGRVRRRADDQHARSHRPCVGQGRRAPQGQPAARPEGAVLGAGGIARRSRRALLPAGPKAGRARPGRRRRSRRRSSAPSTSTTRATRSCSSGACARAPRSRKTTCATAR